MDRVESQQELSPIEVAIEEIERKVAALRAVMVAEPVDMKILQMQIQGTVSLQVCVCVCVCAHSQSAHIKPSQPNRTQNSPCQTNHYLSQPHPHPTPTAITSPPPLYTAPWIDRADRRMGWRV